MTNHDNKIILLCHVLGGFEPKELRGRVVPYKGTATFTREEYDRSKSLQIAVKNGWLTMMKNVPRKLNLSFAKRPDPRHAEVKKAAPALPAPAVQAQLDKDSLKEELRAEMLAELLPGLVDQLAGQLQQNQIELIEKMIESNKANASEIKDALSNVSVSHSGNGVSRPIRRSDEPVFIPDQIRTDDLKANVSPKKSESESLDDATEALRKLRSET